MTEDPKTRRRGFLKAAGRIGLAAALGGGVVALSCRDSRECLRPEPCIGCGRLASCERPEAVAAREAEAPVKDDH